MSYPRHGNRGFKHASRRDLQRVLDGILQGERWREDETHAEYFERKYGTKKEEKE